MASAALQRAPERFDAPPVLFRRCGRKALEPPDDLEAYTTSDAVADLEAVRRAFGYER